MTRKQYDLNFKKRIVAKGKEIGNMTAVARQHELDPKMVLRWARELKQKDLVGWDKREASEVRPDSRRFLPA
ncbi:hypothetical protein ABNF65_04960 [Paenibacillus larvae]